jgi:dihydroflavonol-4-reductase
MILVIGGSGFIGAHLVREALRRGERVRVYDRDPFPEGELGQPQETLRGDILDEARLVSAMAGCNTVYHLAGIPHLWSRDRAAFDRVNRRGTETVLRAAWRSGIERLVYTGTESILVPRRSGQPVTEDAAPELKDMIGPYCRSKFLAEQAVFRAAQNGLPATVVAPTMPIGPGDRNLTPPGRMIEQLLRGRIPAYLRCRLNVVDVRDAALGHILAAEKGSPGSRLLLAGHNVTLKSFLDEVARAAGVRPPAFRIPYGVALAWSWIEHALGLATGREPQSSVTGVKLCKRSLTFDGSRTWRFLGHEPRPLEQTIAETVRWHRIRMQGVG